MPAHHTVYVSPHSSIPLTLHPQRFNFPPSKHPKALSEGKGCPEAGYGEVDTPCKPELSERHEVTCGKHATFASEHLVSTPGQGT